MIIMRSQQQWQVIIIRRRFKSNKRRENIVPLQPHVLVPFSNVDNTNDIPFSLHDYLELVDWSGRHIDPRRRGILNQTSPNY